LDSSDFGNIGQRVAGAVVKAFGVVRNIMHGVEIAFKTTQLAVMQMANAIGSKLIPPLQAFINIYNRIAAFLGMPLISESASQIMGNLPQDIAALSTELDVLKAINPGLELATSMEAFIVANRRAAESIAEVTEAATGAGGVDISAPNFVDRLNDSFTKLHENLPTVQEQMDKMANTTMKNMSDGLMNVVKGTASVKDAFKQMAASLITQAIQLFVIDKITGGFLSFAKGLTGKAIGGSVQSGQPYMVGERGPEMFVPNQSGSIVPNKKMGGGVTVINNVDARGSGADVDQKIKSAMAQTSQQTIMTIQDLMRRRRFV
jgi:phage-related minor tail protein